MTATGPRRGRVGLAALAALATGACAGARAPSVEGAPRSTAPGAALTTTAAVPTPAPPALGAAAAPSMAPSGSPASPRATVAPESSPPEPRGARTSCDAPSLELAGPLDARDAAGLAHCAFAPTGDELRAGRCGQGEVRTPHDLGRLDEAVLAFDAETRRHVREVAARGAALGRKPRSFGLVGDSMTAAPYFLHGFSATAGEPVVLSAAVAASLRTTVDGVTDRTIVDYFRGADAQLGIDSFGARRAAKVGARTEWALSPRSQPTLSPLGNLVARISPSVVLVMYGTNDAGTRFVAQDELTARFEQELGHIVDFVEAAGIVPVLSTLPRHTDDAGRRDCSAEPDDMTDWRLAVQTTAVSSAAARLACRRHLPLVDLRWALEGLPNHGIGEDGVHPTNFAGGGAVLDEHGLQCGYNVRSYLALGMLKSLKEELERPAPAPRP